MIGVGRVGEQDAEHDVELHQADQASSVAAGAISAV